MSSAPATASASTRKPFTVRPSASRKRADRQRRRALRRRSGRSFPPATPRPPPRWRCPCPPRRGAIPALAACCRRAQTADSPARSRWLRAARPPSAFNSPFSGMPDRCAPTTAMAISSAAGAGASGASGGCGTPSAPSGSPVSAWNDAADGRQQRICPARREQRDAERHAVLAHRGRHREPAEIEQVDEVGVGAEPAVELDRIGQHLLDGIDRGRGRQQQRIDLPEH